MQIFAHSLRQNKHFHFLRLSRSFGRATSKAKAAKLDGFGSFEAIELAKKHAKAKFTESIDVSLKLNLDAKNPNQIIRKSIKIPHGIPKAANICVFVENNDDFNAGLKTLPSNVDLVVITKEELTGSIDDVTSRMKISSLTHVFATEAMQPLLRKQLARVLGPRKLLPNVKTGTVAATTAELHPLISSATAGTMLELRTDRNSLLNCPIGNSTFSQKTIGENLRAVLVAVQESKPEKMKQKMFVSASVSSTMGPGFRIDSKTLDPTSPHFLTEPNDIDGLEKLRKTRLGKLERLQKVKESIREQRTTEALN